MDFAVYGSARHKEGGACALNVQCLRDWVESPGNRDSACRCLTGIPAYGDTRRRLSFLDKTVKTVLRHAIKGLLRTTTHNKTSRLIAFRTSRYPHRRERNWGSVSYLRAVHLASAGIIARRQEPALGEIAGHQRGHARHRTFEACPVTSRLSEKNAAY